MIDAILLAVSPFILNGLTSLVSWAAGITDTPGKRLLLAILSLLGAVATAVMNGTPLDPTNVSSLVSIIATTFVAFLMAHGSYHLFFKSASPAQDPVATALHS